MAKANAEATAERVDHLQGMILAGEPNTARSEPSIGFLYFT